MIHASSEQTISYSSMASLIWSGIASYSLLPPFRDSLSRPDGSPRSAKFSPLPLSFQVLTMAPEVRSQSYDERVAARLMPWDSGLPSGLSLATHVGGSWYNHPEVDRIWNIRRIHNGSSEDHILSTPERLFTQVIVARTFCHGSSYSLE